MTFISYPVQQLKIYFLPDAAVTLPCKREQGNKGLLLSSEALGDSSAQINVNFLFLE